MRRILDLMPAPIAAWLRTKFGKHLSRFAVVALISLATTQIVLSIAYLLIRTGGVATLLGWLAGATVSYLLSRKAWDRKGKPDLLRETLPFWIIAAITAIVLTTAGHMAGTFATDHHMGKFDATALVSGTVLLANALTFAMRFVIFHYVVFADPPRAKHARRRPARTGPPEAESLTPVAVPALAADQGAHHG
jgi:uncharacterized membrane protein